MPKIVILTLGIREEESWARENECIGDGRIETIS